MNIPRINGEIARNRKNFNQKTKKKATTERRRSVVSLHQSKRRLDLWGRRLCDGSMEEMKNYVTFFILIFGFYF